MNTIKNFVIINIASKIFDDLELTIREKSRDYATELLKNEKFENDDKRIEAEMNLTGDICCEITRKIENLL